MSDPILTELQSTVAALRSELDAVKAQLKDISRAVHITEENGRRRIRLKCHSLAVSSTSGDGSQVILLSSSDNRGFLSFYYPEGVKGDVALSLGINEEMLPSVRLCGQDKKDRVLLTVDNDHGFAGCLAPGYTPGAIMRAVPGGGSFAVIQPDGKARGIFIHSDGKSSPTGTPGTELLFCSPAQKTTAALRADADSSHLSLTGPHHTSRATLYVREKGAALLIHSDGDATSASVIAMPSVARVATCIGDETSSASEAALASDTVAGSFLILKRPDGSDALHACAAAIVTFIRFNDKDGREAIDITQAGELSVLSMHYPAGTEAISLGTTPESAQFLIRCPQRRDLHACFYATTDKINCSILDGERSLVSLTHSEIGGSVSAFGSGENPGQATITGNTIAGGLVVATSDGTQLLSLDGTDHGGRLLINNDLGFERILLATFQESSNLSLNYAGQPGILASALSTGGMITVHDPEGKIHASLPSAFPSGADDDPKD